jgi:hypothetical protein
VIQAQSNAANLSRQLSCMTEAHYQVLFSTVYSGGSKALHTLETAWL